MKKLLVFQHINREHPSLIAEYANERGLSLDIVPLYGKYSMPIVADWLNEDKEWASADFSLNESAVLKESERLAPVMRAQCFRMMDNFLSV